MESVFDCTMTMINKDFHEYPEHRIQFFKLLQAINLYCFQALLKVDPIKFKSVIDCCMWAAKHDNREVENTGLTMCLELVDNMAETDLQTSSIFFRQFYLPILQDLLFVLTDSDHKAGMFFFSFSFVCICDFTSTDYTLFSDIQASSLKPCFCHGCSTLWNLARFKHPSTRQRRRRLGHPTKNSCRRTPQTCFELASPICKSKSPPLCSET